MLGVGRKPAPAWMRLHRSGFLDKAQKEAASAWKCQSLRSLGPVRPESARACDDVGRFAVAIEVSEGVRCSWKLCCAQFRKSSGLSKIRRDNPFLQQVVLCNYEQLRF